jgi:perosamine synthetase
MNKYSVSFSAVNVPEETYPMMEKALRAGKIGQTDLIEQFEDAIAKYVGAKYCIAVVNGTMADAVAVAAIKEWMNRPVYRAIVPALTFIAQPNSVIYNDMGVTFADIKEDWTLDLESVKDKMYGSIVFGTDLMGRQCLETMDIEDACEALGSKYNGKHAGTFGLLGTFSFFPSHTISTGEGGAIVTDDEQLATLCRLIRAHGAMGSGAMDKFRFPHFGFNARITSLQAVLGIALMLHIDGYIEKRKANFQLMKKILGGFSERDGESIVPHGYPVEFDSEEDRDQAMRHLLRMGVECRKFFSCIPLEEKCYLRVGKYPVTEHVAHTHLYVPCHQNMSMEDVIFVTQMIGAQKGLVKPVYQ